METMERKPKTRPTTETVAAIRKGYRREGKTIAELCKEHSLSRDTVSDIVNMRRAYSE